MRTKKAISPARNRLETITKFHQKAMEWTMSGQMTRGISDTSPRLWSENEELKKAMCRVRDMTSAISARSWRTSCSRHHGNTITKVCQRWPYFTGQRQETHQTNRDCFICYYFNLKGFFLCMVFNGSTIICQVWKKDKSTYHFYFYRLYNIFFLLLKNCQTIFDGIYFKMPIDKGLLF